jgi:hypothetical protein
VTSGSWITFSPAPAASRTRSRRIIPVAAPSAAAGAPPPEPPAFAGEEGSTAAPLDYLALDPVVAAHEVGDEQGARLAVELLRRSLLLDHAVVEQQDPVRHCHRLVLVVRDDERGQAHLQDQLAQPRARLLAQLGVEVGERLVHQDDGRVVDQCARDRDPLLLPAGELVRQARAEVPEAEIGKRGLDPLACLGALDLAQLQAIGELSNTVRAARARTTGRRAEIALSAGSELRRGWKTGRPSIRSCAVRRFEAGDARAGFPLPATEQRDDLALRERIETPFCVVAAGKVQVVDAELGARRPRHRCDQSWSLTPKAARPSGRSPRGPR